MTAVISFWWTFWAVQEEPKFLRPVAFPGLQIFQKWFCGRSAAPDSARGELTTLPQAPNWIWKGEGMRVGEGREGRRKEKRRERERDSGRQKDRACIQLLWAIQGSEFHGL